MSNTQVGSIYQQIIADVIESSRVDFEEMGVDENVLEMLRQGWQKKLSQLEVANFPWDPKPDPILPMNNPSNISSNLNNYQHGGNQGISHQPVQQLNIMNKNGSIIKSEQGPDNQSISQFGNQIPNLPPTTTTAQQRAAAHLHNNYGPRAAASINAIHQVASHGQVNSSIQQVQMLHMMQQKQQQNLHQQQHQLQQHQHHQLQIQHHQQQQQKQLETSQKGIDSVQNSSSQQQPTKQEYPVEQITANSSVSPQAAIQKSTTSDISSAQTDGTSENRESLVQETMSDNDYNQSTIRRQEIDCLIRQKIEAMGSSMEGGGIMLPLKQVTATPFKVGGAKISTNLTRARVDGGDDDDADDAKDEELDEDAINSDLDDPDEGLNEEDEEEDGMGHIMLCMYDKVQRVKNKWKCVMKDGVLTVNNKEYVFHKASGEYEW
ncbi:unnamed protein product [Blumeria hordei]|uniref:Transcription initiation factor IIA large subunit n=2 Tax=Blumeria hordei TaxID=2867405 RepID=A0A383UQA8_BLUHO|nr:transcription factor TFIIA complex subunit Toa1 [Blumeria hordei DH14]SZF01976.1 unnamed protein product [Blumeria hordei]